MSEEKMTKEAMVEVIETLADKVLMLEYYVDDLKHSYKNLINNDDTVRVKVNGVILNVKRREILQEAHALDGLLKKILYGVSGFKFSAHL